MRIISLLSIFSVFPLFVILIISLLALGIPLVYRSTQLSSHMSFRSTQQIALFGSYGVFLWTLWLLISFNTANTGYQFLVAFPAGYYVGVDALSIYFIVLTAAIFPVCILATRGDITSPRFFFFLLLLLEFFLLFAFLTTDLLFFYIAFEATLFPMLLIINIWGSRQRKKGAANYLFLYTLAGSFAMLFAIASIYLTTGTTDFVWLRLNTTLLDSQQYVLWFCFFIAFAVKVPIMPFHLWLPEAHVEAPTIGSIILASLLLKLGGYGLIRISINLLPDASLYFTPFVYILCLISVVYGSLLALRQVDIKKIIAYSSIAHMNIAILGIFSGSALGIQGAIFLMLGHGLVAGALFFCVGILYERSHTRLLEYYGGVAQVMPLFSFFFTFFNVVSVGFPGTCNFVGEFVILAALFKTNTVVCVLVALSTVLGTGYALLLNVRICFGQLKIKYITTYSDVTRRELLILIFFAVWSFILGIYPSLITTITIPCGLSVCTPPFLSIFGSNMHQEVAITGLIGLALSYNIVTLTPTVRFQWQQNRFAAYLFLVIFFVSTLFIFSPALISLLFPAGAVLNTVNYYNVIFIFYFLLMVILAASTLPQQHTNVIDYPLLLLFLLLLAYLLLSASNLIMLFVLIEALNITIYVCMLLDKPRAISRGEAVLKYYTNSVCASGFFLFALLIVFPLEIELSLLGLYETLTQLAFSTGHVASGVRVVCFLFTVSFLFGLFFKLAAYPCSLWAPDVYNTLTAGLIFLFAVFTKFAFFIILFAIARLLFFSSHTLAILSLVGALSLIAGAMGAFMQPSIFRFYAFSSMHHVGLIFITLATGSAAANTAALWYMFGYLLSTATFFVILTTIRSVTGQSVRRFTGLRALSIIPVLGLVICLLSMLGLPPFLGFFLKYYLFLLLVYSENYLFFVLVVITGVISAYNYLWVIRALWTPSAFTSNSHFYATTSFSWFWVVDYFNKNYTFRNEPSDKIPAMYQVTWTYPGLLLVSWLGVASLTFAIAVLIF